ncbi:unnamed protein product [Peronospora farinosa]|uniref:Protein kinase domain-containing protein n=1 Tax=Peronospora farinosa TaxID=134698 RepID=A0ABN8CNV8_9STRA|nr:unnamed protein product [Peronospora farinosa]
MHRKQIIDFAYLELQTKIGAGANAVVFRGTLHSKIPVAIKVYTPRVLCEDVVAAFSHEAALCGALHHPNVVRFYGMCVYPPAVCLVSELCRASLEDVTRASAKAQLHRRSREEQHEQGVCPQGQRQRHQLLIDLSYMIDATRAVVYMHSFTPAFLHRDIKPSNFVVDDFGTCKLTDFGESRSVPGDKVNYVTENTTTAATAATSATRLFGESSKGVQTPSTSAQLVPPPISLRPSLRDRGRNAMTVRGTADYMAPELIEGKANTAVYGEAADIYSLAITLWDIIYPLVPKYPEATRSHLQVFDSVLSGERPPLSPSLHPELHRLLTDAWHQQPERRPSATYILMALETLQQEVGAQTALSLVSALGQAEAPSAMKGELLMQHMIEHDYVDSASEAYCMGNSLMSAGFLHHSQHHASFHKTSDLFYFDADVLGMTNMSQARNVDVQQILLSRQRGVFHHLLKKKRCSTTACHGKSTKLTVCACRKLGRGLIYPDRWQKRRFRRTKRWLSTIEESLLTRKLLSHDIELIPSFAETDGFEDYSNWDDMDSSIMAWANTSVSSIDEGLELSDLDDTEKSAHVE